MTISRPTRKKRAHLQRFATWSESGRRGPAPTAIAQGAYRKELPVGHGRNAATVYAGVSQIRRR